MKRFCRENPAERLGYQKDGIMDIKKHKWFQGFDWDGLLDKTLSPPLVPNVQNVQVNSKYMANYHSQINPQGFNKGAKRCPQFDKFYFILNVKLISLEPATS